MKKLYTHLHPRYILPVLCLLMVYALTASPGMSEGRTYFQVRPGEETISGKILAYVSKEPLAGVNIIVKKTLKGTISDVDGNFSLLASSDDTLVFSFIGYEVREVPLEGRTRIDLELMEDISMLGELEIVSTGYQQLPKERATGSFVQLDNELLNRSTSTNILDRMEGVTPGLIFNRNAGDPINIRGRSTLFANADPLIIIDNFPYEGDINNINPNDVESITVLKDAAAASIWGARAGNGVIVITTKKGAFSQGPQVSFNSNVTVGERPDAFYVPQMSTREFIATEKALFDAGYYVSLENAIDNRALSPVIELLNAGRDGELTGEEVAARIATLEKQDVRKDFEKHLYRESVHQQYAVNIRGGSETQQYFLSAGYDHNQQNLVGNDFSRFTLNAKNTWRFFNDKLRFTGDVYFTQSKSHEDRINPSSMRLSNYNVLPPYTQLTDASGNPAYISRDYRSDFIEDAEAKGLLNWRYNPLEEIKLVDKTNRLTDYRMNAAVDYQIFPFLEASVRYQYWNSQGEGRDHYPEETYYARDLINRYTQVGEDGSLSRPIPVGGILDTDQLNTSSHNVRGQLNFSKTLAEKHAINAMGGFEVRELTTEGTSARYYGYDDEIANSAQVDYVSRYTLYNYRYSILSVRNNEGHTALTDRFVSWYANASYAFQRRYMISLSARKDQSNLFGVNANQRGVPLWSAGLSWNIHEEQFYNAGWMPYLKLRATYGSNGNIDKSVTAYTTARILGNSSNTGLLYASVTNPPNPDLQWERVEMLNLGLDFASRDDRISGSLEYYTKKGRDLIGFAPLPPSSGQLEFKGNTAETAGHGIDVAINTRNIDRAFQWETHWLFSNVDIKVEDYKREETNVNFLLSQGKFGNSPQVGKTPFVIYSYAWAGLDPLTGDPQGYLNGEASTDYTAIINNTTVDSLVYHGSARPTRFGAIRNTFSWRNFSLSVNIGYRLGYYFRRPSIVYGYDRGLGGHGDYAHRWQQPGDEAFTQVPSLVEKGNTYRDQFYSNAAVLVEKGDHIRLQDINLSYTLKKASVPKLPFESVQLYAYARNLGTLWKATDKVEDPDYLSTNAIRSYALGLRVDF